MELKTKSLAFRNLPLWERMDAQTERIPWSGCHLWTGYTIGKGYGMSFEKGRHILAHRASWERRNGRRVPENMFVLHRCDIPCCINPDHLFIGTILDNNRDREAKGRGGQLSGAQAARTWAKLNEDQVREIKEALAIDQRQGIGSALAKKYGVSQAVISGIRHGTGWKHVQ